MLSTKNEKLAGFIILLFSTSTLTARTFLGEEKMQKPSKIRFAEDELKKAIDDLAQGTSEEKLICKSLLNAFEKLEENAFSGIQIPKKFIPKEYLTKYNITNCWKYNLPKGWRLIYAIVDNQEVFVISLILEWFDHKNYEKKFNY